MKLELSQVTLPTPSTAADNQYVEAIRNAKAGQGFPAVTMTAVAGIRKAAETLRDKGEGFDLYPHSAKLAGRTDAHGAQLFAVVFKTAAPTKGRKRILPPV